VRGRTSSLTRARRTVFHYEPLDIAVGAESESEREREREREQAVSRASQLIIVVISYL